MSLVTFPYSNHHLCIIQRYPSPNIHTPHQHQTNLPIFHGQHRRAAWVPCIRSSVQLGYALGAICGAPLRGVSAVFGVQFLSTPAALPRRLPLLSSITSNRPALSADEPARSYEHSSRTRGSELMGATTAPNLDSFMARNLD